MSAHYFCILSVYYVCTLFLYTVCILCLHTFCTLYTMSAHYFCTLSVYYVFMHSQHLYSKGSPEIVKRWVNEAQEALSSDSLMVQYHAMGLLYHIRKKDRLAVSKMVTKQIRSSLRSPHGYCLLIRIACGVLEDEERGSTNILYDFLETCLRHKSEVSEWESVEREGGRREGGGGREGKL